MHVKGNSWYITVMSGLNISQVRCEYVCITDEHCDIFRCYGEWLALCICCYCTVQLPVVVLLLDTSNWRLPWNKRLSANLWRLRKTRLEFSRWIRILLDSELSKVVLFIKSRKTCWGHYVWGIKKTYITALLCYLYTQSIQMYAS